MKLFGVFERQKLAQMANDRDEHYNVFFAYIMLYPGIRIGLLNTRIKRTRRKINEKAKHD